MAETPINTTEPQSSPLDRIELAVCLQRAGLDLNFEDWDGLTDDAVRQTVAHLGTQAGVERDPVRQLGVASALFCGDPEMFERAADAGLFAKLMGVNDEV